MYVLGGETDAQTRLKDCNKCSSHWAHLIWKLSLHNWQWQRIDPQVLLLYEHVAVPSMAP